MSMMDAALGSISTGAAKTGERGGKGKPAQPQGDFVTVVAAKTTKRMPGGIQPGDDAASGLRGLILAIAAEEIQAATPLPDADGTPENEVTGEIPASVETLDDHSALSLFAAQTPRTQQDKPVQITSGADAADSQPAISSRTGSITAFPAGLNAPAEASPAPPAAADAAANEAFDKPAQLPAQSYAASQRETHTASSAIQRTEMAMTADRPGDAAQPRIAVLGFSTATAPVQPGVTSAGLVAAIEAEPTWRAAAEAAASVSQRGPAPHHSVSTLRIQLNPAELGMVTARLVTAGQQLEIEIRVESNDARQRLANDSDAIVKALRAVGYDVDRVTIQQAPQSGATTAQQGSQGRESPMQEQGRQQADANAGGRNGQNGADDDKAAHHAAGATKQERSGGGVYI